MRAGKLLPAVARRGMMDSLGVRRLKGAGDGSVAGGRGIFQPTPIRRWPRDPDRIHRAINLANPFRLCWIHQAEGK
jgi:hypothetical protein